MNSIIPTLLTVIVSETTLIQCYILTFHKTDYGYSKVHSVIPTLLLIIELMLSLQCIHLQSAWIAFVHLPLRYRL